jgi:hypothetical protein
MNITRNPALDHDIADFTVIVWMMMFVHTLCNLQSGRFGLAGCNESLVDALNGTAALAVYIGICRIKGICKAAHGLPGRVSYFFLIFLP